MVVEEDGVKQEDDERTHWPASSRDAAKKGNSIFSASTWNKKYF
jgi:hypothetical protein